MPTKVILLAGIYLHIPYCTKACTYCNFFFRTSTRSKPLLVAAMLKEIELKGKLKRNAQIDTLYFGGGTPGLLDIAELTALIEKIYAYFQVNPGAEVTLEVNPENIHPETIKQWRAAGVNRLSIGLQSLLEEDLRWMNRNHSAKDSIQSVEWALAGGIRSVNIDWIFGSPYLSDEQWLTHLDWGFTIGVDHVSAYGLTVEVQTLLHKKVEKKLFPKADEAKISNQYLMLAERAAKHGWEFYEISNLCKPGFRSTHNTAYWDGKAYLGIGPAAHEYLHPVRSWNIASIEKYIAALDDNHIPSEMEILSNSMQVNEMIMTQLRRMEGLPLDKINSLNPNWYASVQNKCLEFQENGWMKIDTDSLVLTNSGRLFCDRISSDLFVE